MAYVTEGTFKLDAYISESPNRVYGITTNLTKCGTNGIGLFILGEKMETSDQYYFYMYMIVDNQPPIPTTVSTRSEFANYYRSIPSGAIWDSNMYYSNYPEVWVYPTENMLSEFVSNTRVIGLLWYPNEAPSSVTGYIRHELKSTIPIYLCNGDYDSLRDNLNKYIISGDDTGASNYSDLHPCKVDYRVFLDGENYPNLYVSCDLIEGETEGNILSTTNLVSAKTFADNSMNIYTYSEIANNDNETIITLLPKKFYEGTPIMPNDWAVSFLLHDDGRYTILTGVSENGNCSLTVERKVPDSDDYPDDYSPSDDTNNYNGYSGANTLTKTYYLDSYRLIQLGNFLWSNNFKDNILGLINSPIENLVSLKAMPLSNSGDDATIKIGNVETGVNGKLVPNSTNIEVTVGTLFIAESFHNFIDYEMTKIVIYLPYIGFKDLPTSEIMNHKIKVIYHYDCILGNVLADIQLLDDGGNWHSIMIVQGNCGIDISITSTNRASIESSYITNGLSIASNLLTKNVGGAIGSALNMRNQEFHSQSNGVGNPSLMCNLTNMCYVLITRPNVYLPSNYGHVIGYPCYLVKQLKTLNGFTVVENFQSSEIENCTFTEKQMIKDLMENGVYIHPED